MTTITGVLRLLFCICYILMPYSIGSKLGAIWQPLQNREKLFLEEVHMLRDKRQAIRDKSPTIHLQNISNLNQPIQDNVYVPPERGQDIHNKDASIQEEDPIALWDHGQLTRLHCNASALTSKAEGVWSEWLAWSVCTTLPVFPLLRARRRTRLCTWATSQFGSQKSNGLCLPFTRQPDCRGSFLEYSLCQLDNETDVLSSIIAITPVPWSNIPLPQISTSQNILSNSTGQGKAQIVERSTSQFAPQTSLVDETKGSTRAIISDTTRKLLMTQNIHFPSTTERPTGQRIPNETLKSTKSALIPSLSSELPSQNEIIDGETYLPPGPPPTASVELFPSPGSPKFGISSAKKELLPISESLLPGLGTLYPPSSLTFPSSELSPMEHAKQIVAGVPAVVASTPIPMPQPVVKVPAPAPLALPAPVSALVALPAPGAKPAPSSVPVTASAVVAEASPTPPSSLAGALAPVPAALLPTVAPAPAPATTPISIILQTSVAVEPTDLQSAAIAAVVAPPGGISPMLATTPPPANGPKLPPILAPGGQQSPLQPQSAQPAPQAKPVPMAPSQQQPGNTAMNVQGIPSAGQAPGMSQLPSPLGQLPSPPSPMAGPLPPGGQMPGGLQPGPGLPPNGPPQPPGVAGLPMSAPPPQCPGTTWSGWQSWSACTDSCGGCGTQQRFRSCQNINALCVCQGSAYERVACNFNVCLYPRQSPCCGGLRPSSANNQFVCVGAPQPPG